MASEITKSYRFKYQVFKILHYLLFLGPIVSFLIYGLSSSDISVTTTNKVVMSMSAVVCLILGLLALFVELKHKAGLQRTITWTIILTILITLQQVKPFLITLCITSLIDEWIVLPLVARYKNKLTINKEIDKR